MWVGTGTASGSDATAVSDAASVPDPDGCAAGFRRRIHPGGLSTTQMAIRAAASPAKRGLRRTSRVLPKPRQDHRLLAQDVAARHRPGVGGGVVVALERVPDGGVARDDAVDQVVTGPDLALGDPVHHQVAHVVRGLRLGEDEVAGLQRGQHRRALDGDEGGRARRAGRWGEAPPTRPSAPPRAGRRGRRCCPDGAGRRGAAWSRDAGSPRREARPAILGTAGREGRGGRRVRARRPIDAVSGRSRPGRRPAAVEDGGDHRAERVDDGAQLAQRRAGQPQFTERAQPAGRPTRCRPGSRHVHVGDHQLRVLGGVERSPRSWPRRWRGRRCRPR